MYNYQITLKKLLWIGLALVVLTGCGAKGRPAEFKQTAGEMKEGPGVFTGETGEFTVYDSKKEEGFWKQTKGNSEEASEEPGKDAKAAADKPPAVAQTQVAAGKTSQESQVTPEAARDFQEFQEWKQEQKEFQKFQEWKKTSKGAAEYKEFLEWKEWKSYQEWKKQQGQ